MKLYIFLFFLSFSAISGTCDLYKKGVEISGIITSEALECSNEEEVIKDYYKLFRVEDFCGDKGLPCTVISKVVTRILEKQIPEKWECDPRMARAFTKELVYRLCVRNLNL